MVNKNALFQTFMKLESYDKINIISDIIKFSNLFELEFYSSIIESILSYQKISFEALKDELNHDNNILFLKDNDCIDSNTRAQLISTLSLLKVSNISGAAHIFEFLKKNYHKFKELAHTNPSTHEEILLIYQLANNHPAFSFNHCQEIYDYLKEIEAVPLIKDFLEIQGSDEFIIDLNVTSIDKNDQQQYIFVIKATWNLFECCVMRTLEDVYKFYSRIYEMFTLEARQGEICPLYLSFIPDNLEFSKSLMVRFLSDFLKSPSHILRCDYVRQFFMPRISDKCICECKSCQTTFKKIYWAGTAQNQSFEHMSNFSSSNNQSDIEDCGQTFDNKTDCPPFSHFNFSLSSLCTYNNLPLAVSINHDTNDNSLKPMKIKNRIFHSSGSSPINTPSDESDLSAKNGSSKYHCNEIYHQLSKGIQKNDVNTSMKDLRTENWLCQTTNSVIDRNKTISQTQVLIENLDRDHRELFGGNPATFVAHRGHVGNLQEERNDGQGDGDDEQEEEEDGVEVDRREENRNFRAFYSCQIGNLHDWLKQFGLEKNHFLLKNLSFGEFHTLSEDRLASLGFVNVATSSSPSSSSSRKLISLINDLRPSDLHMIDNGLLNLAVRNRSYSIDSSSRSLFGSSGDISFTQRPDFSCKFPGSKLVGPVELPQNSHGSLLGLVPQFCYHQPLISVPNLILLPPTIVPADTQTFAMAPPDKQSNQIGISNGSISNSRTIVK